VESPGLSNRKDRVVDYVNDKDLGVVEGPTAKLHINFPRI
jgi:hypothetical protein